MNYDIEVYGPIPSTQVNNYTTNENTNKVMDDSDTTNPTYEKCYNEVKQLPPSLSALEMSILTISSLDHLPGSSRIGDRPGSGGLLPGLGGGESQEH